MVEYTGESNLPRTKYYTAEDVAMHNCAEDCWVSAGKSVLDLTRLIEQNRGPLAEPIIAAAGTDISYWFNPKTGDVKTCVDEISGLEVPYLPQGRFIHIPPNHPTTAWSTVYGSCWWQDPELVIGKLTARAQTIRVVNVLTNQEEELRVAMEDTIGDIQDRYTDYNAHAASYTWKALGKGGDFEPLDMNKTLTENGVDDDSLEMEKLGMGDESYAPVLHIYFNDDLTVV